MSLSLFRTMILDYAFVQFPHSSAMVTVYWAPLCRQHFLVAGATVLETRQKLTRVMLAFKTKITVSDATGRLMYVSCDYPKNQQQSGWVTRKVNQLVQAGVLDFKFLLRV